MWPRVRWSADSEGAYQGQQGQEYGAAGERARQPGQSARKVFACASATGYYGDRGDEALTEDAAPGSDFLAGVGVEWENATAPASDAGIRVANMRISVVLSAAGGMVATVGPIFRLGSWRQAGFGQAIS